MARRFLAVLCGCAALLSGAAHADTRFSDVQRPTLNYFGLPGMVDMPTAAAMPDGDISVMLSYFGNAYRGTLAFQATPRLTATFRYSALNRFTPNATPPLREFYYDRSFDVHYLALEEARWWPSIAIGIRDIGGTGVFGSEYVVATRHFGPADDLAVTVGLGWGRLGQRNGFRNPLGLIDDRFEVRPPLNAGAGGTFSFDQFFRGNAAIFGGVEWQVNDRMRLQLEYSSDLYLLEVADGLLSVDSPINLGMTYRLSPDVTLGAHYLYGNTFGLSLSLALNPTRPTTNSGFGNAPIPVAVRPADDRPYGTDWLAQPDGPGILRDNVERIFEEDGFVLESLDLDGQRATVRVRNTRYLLESQALGRVWRALTLTMPNSVEVFEVIFVVEGMDTSRIRMNRADVEGLEHRADGAPAALQAAVVEDARVVRDPTGVEIIATRPRFTWGIRPFLETQAFDPDNPLRYDVGVHAEARYEFGRGFVLSGSARARAFGNLDEVTRIVPSAIQPVRTDGYLYAREGGTRVQTLTFAHFGRPGRDLYSRVTVGYLERMFAGVSGELLWQRTDSHFGLGVELNHVWQRDFDGGLGLRDYEVTTGHVSAYFDLGDDFEAQIDAGRFLAGDWGATFSLERTFANGWRVGAFATFTDVPFSDFGEGSFDKGISISIPLNWTTGNATRQVQEDVLRPIQRDGGARLTVDGRLHDLVTDYHLPRLEETQGMIWR